MFMLDVVKTFSLLLVCVAPVGRARGVAFGDGVSCGSAEVSLGSLAEEVLDLVLGG